MEGAESSGWHVVRLGGGGCTREGRGERRTESKSKGKERNEREVKDGGHAHVRQCQRCKKRRLT